MSYNPNYKWINPTYPIYNWGYNPLTKWDEPTSIYIYIIYIYYQNSCRFGFRSYTTIIHKQKSINIWEGLPTLPTTKHQLQQYTHWIHHYHCWLVIVMLKTICVHIIGGIIIYHLLFYQYHTHLNNAKFLRNYIFQDWNNANSHELYIHYTNSCGRDCHQ